MKAPERVVVVRTFMSLTMFLEPIPPIHTFENILNIHLCRVSEISPQTGGMLQARRWTVSAAPCLSIVHGRIFHQSERWSLCLV
ncbi:hypothetical protein ACFL47_00270 [Candidatus Latescibacterota bacterium]